LVFKGSGFYITDYKGKSPSTDHKHSASEKETEPKPESKLEKKSTEQKVSNDNPKKE